MGRKKSDKPKLSWRMKQFIKNPSASYRRAEHICLKETLTEDFMRKYSGYLNWKLLSQNQKMSEDFCLEFYDKIDWMTILNRGFISENFLRNHSNVIKWDYVSRSQMNLSIDFVREFQDKIEWRGFSFNHYNLPMSFLEEFKNKIDWTNLLYRTKNLDEEFVRKHLTDLNKTYSFWRDVASHIQLSEKFLIEYTEKLDWRNISQYQTLSEEFIHNYKDKVYWDYIIQRQILTEKFIEEHFEYIEEAITSSWRWRELLKKQKLGKRFMKRHANCFCWYDVKRDLDYIKEFGGEKYKSKLDDKFVNKMIEIERKREEERHKKYNFC